MTKESFGLKTCEESAVAVAPQTQESAITVLDGGNEGEFIEAEIVPSEKAESSESKEKETEAAEAKKAVEAAIDGAEEEKGKGVKAIENKTDGKSGGEAKPIPPSGAGSGLFATLWGWTKNISFGLFNGLLKGGIIGATLVHEMFFSKDKAGEKKK